jgi:hypothetical protein
MLIARKEPRRHPRVAERWLLRHLEEVPDATIEEAAMVATSLAALAGDRNGDAALTLRSPFAPASSAGVIWSCRSRRWPRSLRARA